MTAHATATRRSLLRGAFAPEPKTPVSPFKLGEEHLTPIQRIERRRAEKQARFARERLAERSPAPAASKFSRRGLMASMAGVAAVIGLSIAGAPQTAAAQQIDGYARALSQTAVAAANIGPFTGAAAKVIPAPVTRVVTSGYYADGDGGSGLYAAQAGVPTYPGSYFQSADGRYWVYTPDGRGVNARAFGAKADGQTPSRVFTGTNNAPMIQAAIDFACYSAKCKIYIPYGIYLVSDALQLNYGTSFRNVIIEGDGPLLRGESSFSGTMLLANFVDRPLLAVNGARDTRIRSLSMMGANFKWVEAQSMVGPQPAVDDTQVANWLDPGLGTSNSRYAPYAAVAIDPYAGTQPATHYPNVTFPAWSGISTQYGKAFSSNVIIEDCWIGGFTACLAIQPCDADGNGDFIKMIKCVGEKNVYVISAGNTQGRQVSTIDCSFACYLAGTVNGVHGRQQGQIELSSVSTDWEQCIDIIDIADSTNAGPFIYQGGYSESFYRIGKWGGSAGDTSPIVFDAFAFHFTAQNDWRGHPRYVLNVGDPGAVTFRACAFYNFKGVLATLTSSALGFSFDNCTINNGLTETLTYRQLATNFLGGGWMLNPQQFDKRPDRYAMKATRGYNINTGATDAPFMKDFSASDRKHPICAWHRKARARAEYGVVLDTPLVWNTLPKSGGSVLSSTFSGSTLTITFNTATWTPAKAMYTGAMPGDVLWDDVTSLVFFVRSYDPATGIMLAELQNGFKFVGGSWDGNGGNTGGTPTLETAFSPTTGNWYCGNSRIYTTEYYLRGDSTSGNTVIANVGRDDGFSSWLDSDAEVTVGDQLYTDELQDRWVTQSNAIVAAVDGTTAKTITLSGNASISYTRHQMKFWIRQPPANV